jgi:hypothetical protein
VGTILFEMLTKEPPFNGANHIQLLSNIEKHDAVRGGVGGGGVVVVVGLTLSWAKAACTATLCCRHRCWFCPLPWCPLTWCVAVPRHSAASPTAAPPPTHTHAHPSPAVVLPHLPQVLPSWVQASPECRTFLSHLLRRNPLMRISFQEFAASPFLTAPDSDTEGEPELEPVTPGVRPETHGRHGTRPASPGSALSPPPPPWPPQPLPCVHV